MALREVYESAATLKDLRRNEPLGSNVVRCLVTATTPTRACEFRVGVVFTVTGVLDAHAAVAGADIPDKTVRINFYDEWAHGASFVEKGDVIILKGFTIVEAPQVPPVAAAVGDGPLFLLPLKADSSLRVLQPSECGDTMEVTVDHDNFDSPYVRVLPRLDHSNRCFVSEIKKKLSAQA